MTTKRKWKIIESSQDTGIDVIKGTMIATKDGDAWLIRVDRHDHSSPLYGVGFDYDGFLYTARGIVKNHAELDISELNNSVGLMQYDVQKLGYLPAKWYHPSLKGKLSEALSTDGPMNSLVGEYRADYADSSGKPFSPLRETIRKLGVFYEFSWWDEDKIHYVGVGKVIKNNLFAAWGPPGSIIQFAYYDLKNPSDTVIENWVDYGRNRYGSEKLSS